MAKHTDALRVITAVYFRRLVLYSFGAMAIIALITIGLTVFLALQVSVWWWLLLIVVLPPLIVIAIILGILWMLSNRLLPRRLSKRETTTVRHFTSTLFGLVETARTPYPLLLVLLGKDILRGKPSKMLGDTIMNSRSLKTEYDQINRMFE